MRKLSPSGLVARCAALRPGPLCTPIAAAKRVLRSLAQRYQQLSAEIEGLAHDIATLVTSAAPRLIAAFGIGPDSAATLLIAAGDNPNRLRSEASFAALCGTSPIPASSGKTNRHRLSRGGARQANAALHRVAIVRLRHDPRTQAYMQRRCAQGLSKKEVVRCLKRYIAREVFAIMCPRPTPTRTDAT